VARLSSFFDSDWYLAQYPDVADAGMNPLEHYVIHGVWEGRDPSPFFDSDWYLAQYPDVADAGMNPLEHYVIHGVWEGRDPSPFFRLQSVKQFPYPRSSVPASPRVRSVGSAEDRKVAIVIPTYGKWHFTERCLQSLRATEANYLAQIYIVDDCYPEADTLRTHRYPEVEVLLTPKNMGFTLACNWAVSQVEEPMVLLLNNDTEVLPGFLTEMLDLFKRDPEAGLVGSRLLYANGTLQECGGIIWRDGSGHNYGRNESPDGFRFLTTREADYCSGASILFSKEIFIELGGFDVRFAPAYYEDVDFAFSVREKGLKVYCCAQSNVIHHEGGTHGTDVEIGLKTYQLRNRDKFSHKWTKELVHHCSHRSSSPHTAMWRTHKTKQIIMYCEPEIPCPDTDAGSTRALEIMKILKEKGYVIYLHHDGPLNSPGADELRRSGIFVSTSPNEFQRTICDERDSIALIWACRERHALSNFNQLKNVGPEIPIVFDTIDLHHRRLLSLAELSGDRSQFQLAKSSERIETYLVRNCSATIVVSSEEQQYLRDRFPSSHISLVSLIYKPLLKTPPSSDRTGLLFIANFRHKPNEDGIIWFLDNVWATLPNEVMKGGLVIVGRHTPESIKERETSTVRVLGAVDNTQELLLRSKLSIAPLRYGAGVKGKILEAWAHGLPVVGTHVAFQGMLDEGKMDVCATDDPSTMSRLISELYGDDEKLAQLVQIGRQRLETHFSYEVAERNITSMLKSVNYDDYTGTALQLHRSENSR
jgi:GT2 family glycosyltransferase